MSRMRILLCPDKFKGTFTAAQVCSHLERGMRAVDPGITILSVPMADGGEGTLEAVRSADAGTLVRCLVQGPPGDWIEAEYLVTPDGTGVLESARFIGLSLVEAGRCDPDRASSAGLGQAIASALEVGVRRFIIGLGGTATVDGGAGMARALGFRLLDEGGRSLSGSSEDLGRLARIDPDLAHPDLGASRFLALCDVDSPLTGPAGAARVFGPQKGASPESILRLEKGLECLAAAAALWRSLPVEAFTTTAGMGAAGGLGFGAAAFLGAELTPGARWLIERTGLAEKMAGADLVVTGEGALDSQTGSGKLVAAVLELAARLERPVAIVTGRWDQASLLPSPRPRTVVVYQGSRSAPAPGLDTAGLFDIGRRIVAEMRADRAPNSD